MISRYLYDFDGWPEFTWDSAALIKPLSEVRLRQGLLLGRMIDLGFTLQDEVILEALSEEAQKSSAIEGESLSKELLRSSIARKLGLETVTLPTDRRVDGVVDMLMDATQKYNQPLTAERIFGWHAALFPSGYSNMSKITVGAWRTDEEGPMQVVSGPYGKETVHYVAPPASRLTHEMDQFLGWFNRLDESIDDIIKAAVAHIWFVTIHPLDDGNGRISRTLSDMLLARSESSPKRFYSMSSQIQKERSGYYEILKQVQNEGLDITDWIVWFLTCLDCAIENADSVVDAALGKSRFWRALGSTPMNDRQKLMVDKLLEGFEGNLTVKKWSIITKVSHDTATRDIQHLLNYNVLSVVGAARNTHYVLALLPTSQPNSEP